MVSCRESSRGSRQEGRDSKTRVLLRDMVRPNDSLSSFGRNLLLCTMHEEQSQLSRECCAKGGCCAGNGAELSKIGAEAEEGAADSASGEEQPLLSRGDGRAGGSASSSHPHAEHTGLLTVPCALPPAAAPKSLRQCLIQSSASHTTTAPAALGG